ncbi:MAG: hypothetical protein AAGK66_02805 [Pseudomonadota bacterium]
MRASRFEVHERREWLHAIPKMIAIVGGLINGRCADEIACENGVCVTDVLWLKREMESLDD